MYLASKDNQLKYESKAIINSRYLLIGPLRLRFKHLQDKNEHYSKISGLSQRNKNFKVNSRFMSPSGKEHVETSLTERPLNKAKVYRMSILFFPNLPFEHISSVQNAE